MSVECDVSSLINISNHLLPLAESENDVLFGDYSDAGVDQVYSEEVIVDSCTNSNRFDDEDEDEEDQDEMQRQLGEQMHIFETKTTTANLFQKTPVIEQVDDKILSRAEEANAELNPLKIKLEAEDCLDALTDSVVSTPDVLDDVITLESDGQFRRRYCGEILQEVSSYWRFFHSRFEINSNSS